MQIEGNPCCSWNWSFTERETAGMSRMPPPWRLEATARRFLGRWLRVGVMAFPKTSPWAQWVSVETIPSHARFMAARVNPTWRHHEHKKCFFKATFKAFLTGMLLSIWTIWTYFGKVAHQSVRLLFGDGRSTASIPSWFGPEVSAWFNRRCLAMFLVISGDESSIFIHFHPFSSIFIHFHHLWQVYFFCDLTGGLHLGKRSTPKAVQ